MIDWPVVETIEMAQLFPFPRPCFRPINGQLTINGALTALIGRAAERMRLNLLSCRRPAGSVGGV